MIGTLSLHAPLVLDADGGALIAVKLAPVSEAELSALCRIGNMHVEVQRDSAGALTGAVLRFAWPARPLHVKPEDYPAQIVGGIKEMVQRILTPSDTVTTLLPKGAAL